jgi:hypothetical protein
MAPLVKPQHKYSVSIQIEFGTLAKMVLVGV